MLPQRDMGLEEWHQKIVERDEMEKQSKERR